MRYALAHGRRSGRRGGAALGEQAVRRLRAEGHDVVIGGALYSDAMGEPGTSIIGAVSFHMRA